MRWSERGKVLSDVFLCVFELSYAILQVDRQPQFIQGYRVMYRQTSGLQASTVWQNLDAKVPTERSAVLVNLKKGVTYEIKVRPYFNEFQGMDSESKTVRTTEEGQFKSLDKRTLSLRQFPLYFLLILT